MWIIVYTCLCMACDCQANFFTANYNCFLQLSYYILIYIVFIFQHTSMNCFFLLLLLLMWISCMYLLSLYQFLSFILLFMWLTCMHSFVYVIGLQISLWFMCLSSIYCLHLYDGSAYMYLVNVIVLDVLLLFMLLSSIYFIGLCVPCLYYFCLCDCSKLFLFILMHYIYWMWLF